MKDIPKTGLLVPYHLAAQGTIKTFQISILVHPCILISEFFVEKEQRTMPMAHQDTNSIFDLVNKLCSYFKYGLDEWNDKTFFL